MLQEKLKQATQGDHDILEALMFVFQIMGGTLTLLEYKQILTTNYLVHQRFEDSLTNGLDVETAQELDMNNHHKLAALSTDLSELNMSIPQPGPNLPNITFDNAAQILGALYVLEGATLGGNVIVKRLKLNPTLNSLDLGFHYYQVYGENLIPNWKKFCEVLNKQPEVNDDESIAGAKKMFEYIAAVQDNSNQMVTS